MVKVSKNTDKAGRNRERQLSGTPRKDIGKAEGATMRGKENKVNPGKCPFSHERGAGS